MNEVFLSGVSLQLTVDDCGITVKRGQDVTEFPYGSIEGKLKVGMLGNITLTGHGISVVFVAHGKDKARFKEAIAFAEKMNSQAAQCLPKEYTLEETESIKRPNAYEQKAKKKELRKRCNVCGKIFCFTEDDYVNSLNHLTNAAFSSIGAIANAAAGSAWASNELNKSADRQMNRFVDYNRCPVCNSTDLTLLSEEEFEAMKNTQSQPAAQEPKKTLVEQMAEYKQLLDMGVITQEEFDAKKKQLLRL